MRDRPDYLRLVADVDREVQGFGIDTERVAEASNALEADAKAKLPREDDQVVALVLAAYGLITSEEGYRTFTSAVKVCRLASEGASALR